MQDIFIDASKEDISIKVNSQSLHAVGFDVTVFNSDGNTVSEPKIVDDTETNNPNVKLLQNKPSTYKGKYVSGIFTIESPDGTDYDYTVSFSIIEDNVDVHPEIVLKGKTVNGKDTKTATFHLN